MDDEVVNLGLGEGETVDITGGRLQLGHLSQACLTLVCKKGEQKEGSNTEEGLS